MAQRHRPLLGGAPPPDAVMVRYAVVSSPIGGLLVWGDGETLRGLSFADSRRAVAPDPTWTRDDNALREVASQLRAYFSGDLTRFELDLELGGTSFQRRVWAALLQIPYGSTTTYGQLASELGDPRGTRAVGAANGRNPIAIIIPCHRVIGADGGLTGYGGGLDRKKWLIEHERR